MATVTKTLGSVGDANGNQATLQVDYDDVALRLLLVRIINGTAQTAEVTATATADPARTATLDCPAGQTLTQTLPSGAQTRLNITIDSRGRLDGVDYHFLLL